MLSAQAFAQEMVAQVQRFCDKYCTRLPAYSMCHALQTSSG